MRPKANARRGYSTKTGCGITSNVIYADLAQPQRFREDYTLGGGRVLELQQEAADQNTVTDIDIPDCAVNYLSEDLVEGLEYGGNRESVDDDVGETIDCGAYDMIKSLEGRGF